jgi:hypothetical protein
MRAGSRKPLLSSWKITAFWSLNNCSQQKPWP